MCDVVLPDALPSTIRSSSRSRKRTWKVNDNDEQIQEQLQERRSRRRLRTPSPSAPRDMVVFRPVPGISEMTSRFSSAVATTEGGGGMVFLAREPLQLDANGIAISIRHNLGAFDIVCGRCQTLHWHQEATVKSVQTPNPQFSTCCQNGRVVLPPLNAPLPLLRQLFLDGSAGTLSSSSIAKPDCVN
jgi:hypothetical protein